MDILKSEDPEGAQAEFQHTHTKFGTQETGPDTSYL